MELFIAEELTLEPEDYETITIDTDFIHFDDNGDPPIFVEQSEPFPLWGLEGNNEGRGDCEDVADWKVGQLLLLRVRVHVTSPSGEGRGSARSRQPVRV